MTNSGNYNPSDIALLRDCKVPQQFELLRDITTGFIDIGKFINDLYFDFYIPRGGSKIKFLTGRPGTGKTHFMRLLRYDAAERGFLTVSFSAKEVWLHDFRELYLEILRQCDLELVLKGCADSIIRELGYEPDAIPDGQTLMAWLGEQGQADALTRGEIRSSLRQHFTRNPLLDNMFGSCCSLLVGGILGHPVLEASSRDLIMAHMHGDKSVKLSQLRALGLSPSRITKYNARHLLRSLSEIVHFAGFSGLIVLIDDMEILQQPKSDGAIRYTKSRRDDAYENIRQLIDDIDSMRYIMFMLSFRRDLMDNEDYGLKSYQALWFRVQSEVVSARFNRFADIIDLDRLSDEVFTPEALVNMSAKISGVLNTGGVPVSLEDAEKLIGRSEYGSLGLPYLVIKAVCENSYKSKMAEIESVGENDNGVNSGIRDEDRSEVGAGVEAEAGVGAGGADAGASVSDHADDGLNAGAPVSGDADDELSADHSDDRYSPVNFRFEAMKGGREDV